jgi:hypothetical protein
LVLQLLLTIKNSNKQAITTVLYLSDFFKTEFFKLYAKNISLLFDEQKYQKIPLD